MPQAAPRPCSHPGCGRLVPMGQSCPVHPRRAGSFADRQRGTRHERGYDAEWDRSRRLVMQRDRGLCQPCLRGESFDPPGERLPSRTSLARAVDHIVSKAEAKRRGWSREQTDDPANLQAICTACHKAKTRLEMLQGRGLL